MAYTRYKADSYWKRARTDGTSADGNHYAKGDRVFFYPRILGSLVATAPSTTRGTICRCS